MKEKLFENQIDSLAKAQGNIVNVLDSYFFTGNIQHQVGLLSNAIQEVVSRGSDDTDASLDNAFGYTSRYIRESIYDLTELQKFLIKLDIVYGDYKRQCDDLLLGD